MAWIFDGQTYALTNGQTYTSWINEVMEIYAMREREAVAGLTLNSWNFPPADDSVWDTGTITSITDSGSGSFTVSLTATNPFWDSLPDGASRWVGGYDLYTPCGSTDEAHFTHAYDFIIVGDKDDPFTCLRGKITAQTYTGPVPAPATLTILSLGNGTLGTFTIADAITAGFIPSLSYLAGKTYYIITDGYNWTSDRLIDKPNDRELDVGSDSIGDSAFTLSVVASGGTGTLTYSWACSAPTGLSAQVSVNGTTAAATTLALVNGTSSTPFVFTVTVTDATGLNAYSIVSVTVSRAGGGITITSTNPTPPAPDSGGPTIGTPASATYTDGLFPWLTNGVPGSTNYTTITDQSGAPQGTVTNPWLKAAWKQDQFVGNEVLIYGSDGYLHREMIAHNTAGVGGGLGSTTSGRGVLYIAATSYTPGGIYSLIPAGKKGIPGRQAFRRRQFYTGLGQAVDTVLPDLSIGSWPIPATNYTYSDCDGSTDPATCQDSSTNPFDVDYQIATNNVCALALRGRYIARDYWKSRRSRQVRLPYLAAGFVPAGYSGGAQAPLNYTPATWFAAAGINSGTSSLTYVSGTGIGSSYTFDASQFKGIPIYWAVLLNSTQSYITGYSTPDVMTGLVNVGATHPQDDNSPVTFSAGWTRYMPRHFQYLFSKSIWIADDVDQGDGPAVVDPPVALTQTNTPANAVESLPFVDSTGAGAFTILIESTTTDTIIYSPIVATLIASINTALNATFGASNIVASGASLSALIVTFSGGSYADRPILPSSNGTVSANIIATLLTGSTGFTVGNNPVSSGTGPTLAGGSTTVTVGVAPTTYTGEGVGKWNWRGASTNYIRYDGPNATMQAGVPFVTGDLVRYVGDNPPDPSITGNADDNLTPYYARFARMNYDPVKQAQRNASKIGTIAKGTPDSFTCFGQNWWSDLVGNSGVLVTQSMTATDGSTTTFVDASLNPSNNVNPEFAWWATTRFIGAYFQIATVVNPFLNFTLEVDKVYTHTDLTVDATNNLIVTSSGHSFTTADITASGVSTLVIPSGITGWTAGNYRIVSVDATGKATLNMSPAAIGTTGGHYTLTTTFERLITATVATTTVEVAFNALTGFTVAARDVGRIKEPKYELNKWITRRVKMIRTDGTAMYRHCLASSNQTVFFDPSETDPYDQYSALGNVPGAGWSFSIQEPAYGAVWQWNGTKFIDPGGPVINFDGTPSTTKIQDTYRLGIPESGPLPYFLKSLDGGITPNTGNLETHTIGYGPGYRGDLLTRETRQEYYDGMNLLMQTLADVSWTSRADPSVPELNLSPSFANGGGATWGPDGASDFGGSFIIGTNYDNYSDALGGMYTDYGAELVAAGLAAHIEDNGIPPQCSLSYGVTVIYRPGDPGGPSSPVGSGMVQFGGDSAYAYPTVVTTTAMTELSCSIQCYAEAGITAGNAPAETGTKLFSYINADGSTNPEPIGYTYSPEPASFNAQDSGLAYRQWTTAGASFGPASTVGTAAIGPKIGNNIAPTNPTIPAPVFPGGYDESEGDDRDDVGYGGIDGYCVINQIAIVKWGFQFLA